MAARHRTGPIASVASRSSSADATGTYPRNRASRASAHVSRRSGALPHVPNRTVRGRPGTPASSTSVSRSTHSRVSAAATSAGRPSLSAGAALPFRTPVRQTASRRSSSSARRKASPSDSTGNPVLSVGNKAGRPARSTTARHVNRPMASDRERRNDTAAVTALAVASSRFLQRAGAAGQAHASKKPSRPTAPWSTSETMFGCRNPDSAAQRADHTACCPRSAGVTDLSHTAAPVARSTASPGPTTMNRSAKTSGAMTPISLQESSPEVPIAQKRSHSSERVGSAALESAPDRARTSARMLPTCCAF